MRDDKAKWNPKWNSEYRKLLIQKEAELHIQLIAVLYWKNCLHILCLPNRKTTLGRIARHLKLSASRLVSGEKNLWRNGYQKAEVQFSPSTEGAIRYFQDRYLVERNGEDPIWIVPHWMDPLAFGNRVIPFPGEKVQKAA
jgi:hypothetical protein